MKARPIKRRSDDNWRYFWQPSINSVLKTSNKHALWLNYNKPNYPSSFILRNRISGGYDKIYTEITEKQTLEFLKTGIPPVQQFL